VELPYAGSRCFEEPTEGFPGMLARTLNEQRKCIVEPSDLMPWDTQT